MYSSVFFFFSLACPKTSLRSSSDAEYHQSDEEIPSLNVDIEEEYPVKMLKSFLIKINVESQENPEVLFSQEELGEENAVSLQGNIICESTRCNDTMIMRIVSIPELDEDIDSSEEFQPITSKHLSKIGAYSIWVPKSDKAVVIELLVDSNNDGVPSLGERMAILEIIPNQNILGLDLDISYYEVE